MPDPPARSGLILFAAIDPRVADAGALPGGAASAAPLQPLILAHGGTILPAPEGSICATFRDGAAALAAALTAARLLPLAGLALHRGALPGGALASPALRRGAAVLAAGHPGQILLTRAAADLVRAQLPPGVGLRDLGERRLADLLEREGLFQVLAPDLPATFPPLRTLDLYPHNLSPQLSALVGREREEVAAQQALRAPGGRLLTLTGPAGAGKTRLALQIAAAALADFPQGAWFVALGPLQDPALVPAAIAGTLEVKESGGAALATTLGAYLRTRQLLLILDNFEHLAGAIPLVGDLLAAAPGLRLLVTSRAPLHLAGEITLPVPPLGLPDLAQVPDVAALAQYEAVALFLARAAEVQPEFRLTAENASAVAEICVRLDGLPLAIELAAVRVRQLPPAALLARLLGSTGHASLPFLTSGAPHLPARQQTLRGAISWSYQLLAPPAQHLFAALAVFPGGCSLEAASTVAGPEGRRPPTVDSAALDVALVPELAALCESSLLRQEPTPDGTMRYRMLETIQEYAAEQLDESGQRAALWARQAAYYLALAETAAPELAGPAQDTWLARLAREVDNFRAALAWALAPDGDADRALRLAAALGRFWQVRGYLSEGRRWLAGTLAAAPAAPAPLRARALALAGQLATDQGDYATARPWIAESLALYRALDDPAGIADALNRLGALSYYHGDYRQALALYHESLALRRTLGDRDTIAISLNNLGILANNQGDYPAAAAY
ncbi:MAG TPA: tetratricopeptide repeat protein, partial [Chloroflexia bacterium]|nr:tetratricopeptide repeat protein [Chloroflexia bacterium]